MTHTLTSTTSTQAVVNHQLEGFFARDLPVVLADYAPDAVMIVPGGVLRGVQDIRPFFQALVAEFSKADAAAWPSRQCRCGRSSVQEEPCAATKCDASRGG